MNTKRFNFKKKFGQNFIKNKTVIKNIVSRAQILPNSLVIEVGPGAGALTKELSKVAKQVLCYEIDTELEDILAIEFHELDNVKVLFKDFLTVDIALDLKNYKYDAIYFVSNVPYYITTPILMKLMESGISFEKIVMMVQKEVGDRFAAIPGKKDYSSITVYLNYFYYIKKEFIVKRSEFIPVPNVDSIIISFAKKEKQLDLKNKEHFFNLVRESFKFKRKTIKNNLKNFDLSIIEKILNKHHFDLTVRAESLPVEVFVEISNSMN